MTASSATPPTAPPTIAPVLSSEAFMAGGSVEGGGAVVGSGDCGGVPSRGIVMLGVLGGGVGCAVASMIFGADVVVVLTTIGGPSMVDEGTVFRGVVAGVVEVVVVVVVGGPAGVT